MKSELLVRERILFSDAEFVEMVVWRVPSPVPPSDHDFKYRLVYIERGERIIGYDNERGKGNHRHFLGSEHSIEFTTIEALLQRFIADVEAYRGDT